MISSTSKAVRSMRVEISNYSKKCKCLIRKYLIIILVIFFNGRKYCKAFFKPIPCPLLLFRASLEEAQSRFSKTRSPTNVWEREKVVFQVREKEIHVRHVDMPDVWTLACQSEVRLMQFCVLRNIPSIRRWLVYGVRCICYMLHLPVHVFVAFNSQYRAVICFRQTYVSDS